MSILIKFDLPYSLNVNGSFLVKTPEGEIFQTELTTQFKPGTDFPGAEYVENIAIVNDDTNIVSYTSVAARYSPANLATLDPADFSNEVAAIALAIANTLVTGVRIAYDEYIKDYLYSPSRLGPIAFEFEASASRKGASGFYDPMMGGITTQTPPRKGADASKFSAVVASGAPVTVSQELYFDARRYLIQQNYRMALASLVISFEVGLADTLVRIAKLRGDSALEISILEATLGQLGSSGAKRTLGESFDKSSFWGAPFTESYLWLRDTRNKILHRAQTSVSRGSVTRDFTDKSNLTMFFMEHDSLKQQIDDATENVLNGRPPI